MKTYSIRLFPTSQQIVQLQQLSDVRNDMWNVFIEIQQNNYNQYKKILNTYDLQKTLTQLKHTTKQEWQVFNSKAAQAVASQVFVAYQSFFTLVRKDKTIKPPQKLVSDRLRQFHSLVFHQSGWSFKNNLFCINKISFNYKTHLQNIDSLDVREIRVKLKNDKWLCDVTVEERKNYQQQLTIQNKILALDLGLKKLATGIDNEGNTLILPNKAKKVNKYFYKHINKLQSKLSKKQKDSKQYRHLKQTINKLYSRKNGQVKQTLHIQSKQLANMNYNTIVIGDLTVKKLLIKKDNKRKKISRSFSRSNITMFLDFLKYKCETKNTNVIKIDERWTTQLNCLTGKLFDQKIQLKDRTVKLNETMVIDRDLNSAINILNRHYDNHLVSVSRPLDLSIVLERNNLFKKITA